MSNLASIGLAPRVQTVGLRDPHRAGRYKGPLVGHSTFPGGLELSTRCTGSSRGLGAVAFVRLVGGFGRRSFFLLAWVLSVWCAWVLCSWGGDFGVRLHASGGRSCTGWRAQRTPRGAQCISSDASLFTIGSSSRVESSTLHTPVRPGGGTVLRNWGLRSRFGLQDGFGGVGWTVQRTPCEAQYMPRDVA